MHWYPWLFQFSPRMREVGMAAEWHAVVDTRVEAGRQWRVAVGTRVEAGKQWRVAVGLIAVVRQPGVGPSMRAGQAAPGLPCRAVLDG